MMRTDESTGLSKEEGKVREREEVEKGVMVMDLSAV